MWRALAGHISCRSRRVTVAEDQSHGRWMSTGIRERVVQWMRVAELVAGDCFTNFEVDRKHSFCLSPSSSHGHRWTLILCPDGRGSREGRGTLELYLGSMKLFLFAVAFYCRCSCALVRKVAIGSVCDRCWGRRQDRFCV